MLLRLAALIMSPAWKARDTSNVVDLLEIDVGHCETGGCVVVADENKSCRLSEGQVLTSIMWGFSPEFPPKLGAARR